jgi:hypothetical protein
MVLGSSRPEADVSNAASVLLDIDIDTEHVLYALLCQHFPGLPEGNETTTLHDRDPVAEHGSVIEVMQSRHHSQILALNQIEKTDLMTDVEMIGRRATGSLAAAQAPSNVQALTLTAG